MARYAAETAVTHVSDIDYQALAPQVHASAYYKSAFMPGVSSFRSETRVGTIIQQGTKTWTTMDFDAVALGGQDETVYNPTGRSYTCTGRGVDTVVGQYANWDGSGQKDIAAQIIEETARSYASYFDATVAALYTEATASTHELGASTSPLSASLIDAAIAALLGSGAPEPFHLVIDTTKVPELMQIPHMRDRAIRGGNGGGIEGPELRRNNSALLVKGYAGVLDVYHSPEITVSTGTHNIMYAVGNGTNGAIANPWVPLKVGEGNQPAPSKIWMERVWNPQSRAFEVCASTIEAFLGSVFTSTTNSWMVDIITTPAS